MRYRWSGRARIGRPAIQRWPWMRFRRERSRSSLRNCSIESFASTTLLPRPVMVGKESSGVRGMLDAVSSTGCWPMALESDVCEAESEDGGGMGRKRNGGFRTVVWSLLETGSIYSNRYSECRSYSHCGCLLSHISVCAQWRRCDCTDA